jgi:FMN phosphatase YigB (HAD superfamily)
LRYLGEKIASELEKAHNLNVSYPIEFVYQVSFEAVMCCFRAIGIWFKMVKTIAFDLHGVIFHLDWRQILKLFWHYPHKFRLLLCCLDPRMMWHGTRVLLHHPTDEECYAVFERFWPRVLPFIIECTAAQKPIAAMVSLLHELKAKGYQLHLVSNSGPRRFALMEKQFGDIVALFDCVCISNGDVADLIKKPQRRFFVRYLQQCGADPKTVLFIDDSKGNIAAAQCAGLQTIRFKNARQLVDAFNCRGI